MKCYILRANWKDQQDSIRVVVFANSMAEAIEKAEAKYEDFFLVFASEIKDFIQ